MTTRLQQARIDAVRALGKSTVTIDDLRPIFVSNHDWYIKRYYKAMAREYGLPSLVASPKGPAGADIEESGMPKKLRETIDDLYSSGLQVMDTNLVDGEVVYQIK